MPFCSTPTAALPLAAAVLALAACSKPASPASVRPDFAMPELRLEPAFPSLAFDRPLWFAQVPGTDQVLVAEQGGRVWGLPHRTTATVEERRLVLDLSGVVLAPGSKAHPGGNEEGLLGLAFHPNFTENRMVFAHYSVAGKAGDPTVPAKAGPRRGWLSRFRCGADGVADPASEEILLEVDQPESNHNGGMIAFGPDGMLYMALGDGGGAGDKHGARGNGQDTGTLLGKILRLDVGNRTGAAAYTVPTDNPFVGKAGFRPEIWALGLRNPWRFSFDRVTGELWCGDVGQNAHEEIDLIVRGGNYGWRIREGKSPFQGKEEPATLPLLEPVTDHERVDALSVTGGHVYRGKDLPGLRGWYVYADFVTGNFWRLRRDAATGKVEGPVKLPFQLRTVSSFGEDGAGEIFVCCFDGKIYKLTGK